MYRVCHRTLACKRSFSCDTAPPSGLTVPIMSCSLESMSPSLTLAAHSAASCSSPAAASSSALCFPSGSLPMILHRFLSSEAPISTSLQTLRSNKQVGEARVLCQCWALPMRLCPWGQAVTSQVLARLPGARADLPRVASGAPASLATAMKGSRPMGDFFSLTKVSRPSQSFNLARAFICVCIKAKMSGATHSMCRSALSNHTGQGGKCGARTQYR